MGSLASDISLMLINALFGLYLLIVLLRFLFQLVHADFYNPISQFIVKATTPLLKPLRKMIPGYKGLDIASLVLALLVQMVGAMLVLGISGYGFNPANIVIWSALLVGNLVLKIYFWGLIILVIASWIAPNNYNPALVLIHQLVEPVTTPIRKRLPDMGGLDISPIFVFLLITILEKVLFSVMVGVHMPAALAMFV
ncbi:MAG: YggT family protein [Hahellaceae bacterium]|nr:YggT family protein [Hahellaceae bacterium]MCP5168422.1 YggT family protein [Hahellaceae bacterium]